MNVIVYYPKTEQGAQGLVKRVARVHAEARYIEKLPCPKEQKEALFEAIIQEKLKEKSDLSFDSSVNLSD